MKKWLLLLLLIVVAVITWGIVRKNAPPEVKFTRARRQTLVSTLPTNGKAEPIEWQAVRTAAAGLVSRVPVQGGQTVAAGAVLAELTDPSLQADIEAAQAKVTEVRVSLAALEAGGKPSELTEIDNSLARARFDLQKEQKEYETLQRLQAKQAVTAVEVQAAADKMHQTEIEIAGLQKRRGSLVSKSEVDAARARLQDAESALQLARARAAESVVRAPIAGEIYGLDVRPGAYVNVGDLVANIGHLNRLRVRVYVDEPLLGRVAAGQPVTIRWEALPGKQWQGSVDRMPTAIQALGSRQVGEVVCAIENPGRDLIPGTNVDAEIRTAVAENALVIPKETLHHDAAGDYVFALKGDTVERRAVKTGNSTVTQVQITEGLGEGDSVALPGEVQVKSGDRVSPSIK
ncbi:Efflux transporter, RND family, MFP subunit [Candidatus Sulfopaludibacter sp. SbA3]|nr:Efflux transporter, RND family, MFP subunit [Candidatus Sulfopaludibacter sp. SbA3]